MTMDRPTKAISPFKQGLATMLVCAVILMAVGLVIDPINSAVATLVPLACGIVVTILAARVQNNAR